MNSDKATTNLEPGNRYFASIQLRDGRELRTPVVIELPRPQIALLSKGTQDQASDAPPPVKLGSPDDLPVEGRLVFFLKSKTPANFPRNEKVEVAAVDGSFHTMLSLADGSLILEDSKTALGVVEPLSRFGSSAFGPLQARAVSADDVAGDWLPLGTLVRIPGFRELRCPRALSKPCLLSGSNLFLTESLAANPDFDNPVDVPPDFTGTELTVPHPTGGNLYVKLRDDPQTVQTLLLPVQTISASALNPARLQLIQPSPPAPGGEETAPPPADPRASHPAPEPQAAPTNPAPPNTTPEKPDPEKTSPAPANSPSAGARR
jgi:hypothetical protein